MGSPVSRETKSWTETVGVKEEAVIEGTIGTTPELASQVLAEQAKEEALKKAKLEAEELQKTVIAHTERYNNARAETLDEIMYGPRKTEPTKKE